MTSGVPWQLNGVSREAIEAAREAARRSGMSVAEWLDGIIAQSAAREDTRSPPISPSDFDGGTRRNRQASRQAAYITHHEHGRGEHGSVLSDVSSRLDALSRQLDHLTRERTVRQSGWADDARMTEAESRSWRRPDAAEGRIGHLPDRQVPRADDIGQEQPIDEALAEIEARMRALDGESPASPRVELARAPTQRLPDLEQQLRDLNARIETMRPCGLDRAVETLRDDLAEIGVMLKDAMPRQAIEALESEVRALASRIDNTRHAGVDDAAIAGVERGLEEVRDALRRLTPAEQLAGFEETVRNLAQKVDGLAEAQDPAALKQLEGAIVALRGVVSHAASNDALANLSEEVRLLAAKVDQVTGADAFSMMEQRISSIADALQSRNRDTREAIDFEAAFASLFKRIDQLQLSRTDQTAVAHLEDRIVRLVEKLDASDSRLNQLEAIERGLAELLVHLESQRNQPAQPAGGPSIEAEEIKRDVQRTQDSLEAVHGTLGHVVDRLATIETTIRTSHATRPAAPGAAPDAERMSSPATPPAKPAQAPPAPEGARTAAVALSPPAERPTPAPAASTANPAPARDRRPIDPDLPPDQPLEPGDVRARGGSSPSDRIAASEAALGGARPPVIADPGGKANFIAAARRAAQAAIVEAPQSKDRKDAKASPPIAVDPGSAPTGNVGGKIRKIVVGVSAMLLVLGAVHFVATKLWRSPPTGTTAQTTTPVDNSPAITAGQPKVAPQAEHPPALPSPATTDRRSALPAGEAAVPANPPGGVVVPPAIEPDLQPTGSILPPASAVKPGADPTPPSTPARNPGADRLPAAIGGAGLRAAAAKGDPAATFEIATRFAEGRGVNQNLTEAAAWFEKAAGKGLALAQFRLGGLYEKGLGVRKNLDTARRLYTSAAEAGNAKAMHNLAVLYAEGIDGRPDYPAAARWFRRAADHGVIDSQYNLAILYARGIGVEANHAEAFKWFALASREGDREAQRRRDETAARLDRQTLAAAMKAAQSWQAQPQPPAATQVQVPAGGWDAVQVPSAAKRTVGPKSEAPSKGPAQ